MRVVVGSCRAESDAEVGGRVAEVAAVCAGRLAAHGFGVGVGPRSAVRSVDTVPELCVGVGVAAALGFDVETESGEIIGPVPGIAGLRAHSVAGLVDPVPP